MDIAKATSNTNAGVIRAFAIVVGMAVLLFPAWMNGSPFVFHDTNAYYRAGQSLLTLFTPAGQPGASNADGQTAIPQKSSATTEATHHQITHLSARSPFYGVLLYVLGSAAGLWGIVILQAFAASYVLWRVASAFSSPTEHPAFFAVLAVAAIATSQPWFVSFAMPDIWIGLSLLLLGVLAFSAKPLTRPDAIALALLTFAAAAFHTSNAPVLIAAILAVFVIARALKFPKEVTLRACASAALGLVIAVVAGWTFYGAAAREFHERLRSPIFLTARLLADGPGRAYLLKSCADDDTRYTLCKFKDRPLDHADGILWSSDPQRGVWAIADFNTRLALSDEQYRFALSTLLYDPWHVATAAIGNTAKQLSKFGLPEFADNYWKKWANNNVTSSFEVFDIIPSASFCLEKPPRCAPPQAVFVFEALEKVIFLLSTAILFWNLFRSATHRISYPDDEKIAGLSLFFLAICFANAFVCGALAGPFDRYQARLIWIAPVLATILIFRHREALMEITSRTFAQLTKAPH